MNAKFEMLLSLLNDKVKQAQFKILFQGATNFEKLELIAILKEHLNINEVTLNEMINKTLKSL